MKFDYKYFIVKYFPVIRHRYAVYEVLKNTFSFLRHLPGSSLHFGPPRGIYLDATSYNAVNNTNPIQEFVLSPCQSIVRDVPKTNSELLAQKWQRLVNKILYERVGYILHNARYFSGYAGTIVTSDDKIFIPCSPLKNAWKPCHHDSLYRLRLPKCESLDKVVVVDTKGAHNNFGHWMRDHLSRFFWLQKMNVDLSEYTLITSFGDMSFQKYSLDIMKKKGFDFKEIIPANEIKHLKANVIVVPPIVNPEWDSDHYSYDVRESTDFLKHIFLEDTPTIETFDKIFISRRKSRRTSPQEPALIAKLALYGIKEVFMEDYNISQQASLFNNASLIMGFHGSGFANLYFCKSETTIVEIFSPDYLRTDFWDQAAITDLNYFAYCEDEFSQNISSFRLAIEVSTAIDIDNFIDYCKRNSILELQSEVITSLQ